MKPLSDDVCVFNLLLLISRLRDLVILEISFIRITYCVGMDPIGVGLSADARLDPADSCC